MFLSTDYNPEAPQMPGRRGLYFEAAAPDDTDLSLAYTDKYIVFVKTKGHGLALWLFIGEYELSAAAPLTVEEWGLLEPVVRTRAFTRVQCFTSDLPSLA